MNTPSDADQGVLDMFSRKKNDAEEANNGAEGVSGAVRENENPDAETTLDVPSREPPAVAVAAATSAPVVHARPARRTAKPHQEPVRRIVPGADSEGKCLVVSRNISLSGQIKSCEKLIVEGTIETEIDGCRELEVARTGVFKGNAEVETADISGSVEGSLTAREILVVRASGRIRGNISYGQLEVERGGILVGEVQPCSEDDSRETAPVLAAESPVG